MAAPTPVWDGESAWSTGTPQTVTIPSVQAGDVILVLGSGSTSNAYANVPTATGQTFTLIASRTGAGYNPVYAYAAVVDTARTDLVVDWTRSSGSSYFGVSVMVFRDAVVGATATAASASGAPSVAITTGRDNSAIAYMSSDNTSGTGSRTARTSGVGAYTETYYATPAATFYAGYWADTSTAGAKTVGFSAPTGQEYAAVAVEVKRVIEAAPTAIATAEALGSPTAYPWVLAPAGIASAEAVGSPTAYPWVLAPAGIASAGAVGTPAVSQDTWREIIAAPWWLPAVTDPGRTVESQVEMIDATGNHVLDLPVTDGKVTFRGGQAEQRSAQFSLTDPAFVPRSDTDVLAPASGLRAQVWWRLRVAGGWVRIPLGCFYLANPEVSESAGGGLTITVAGQDVISVARRAQYGTRVIDVGGLTVTDALRALFAAIAPGLPLRVAETTVTLPAVYELTSRDPATDWEDIAALAGWTVRSDAEGTIVAGPVPDPSTVRLDLQEGPDCRMTEITNQLVTDEMVNQVIVVSTSPKITAPVSAVVEDDDEGSPTWVGGIFGVRSERVESDAVETVEAATNLARVTYDRLRRPRQSVRVVIPQRGDIDYLDRATVVRARAGVAGAYQVAEWDLPLPVPGSNPGRMSVTMMTRSW